MTENEDELFEEEKVTREIISGKKINPNRFRMSCDTIQSCFALIDQSMFEVLELKDKLLLQYLPRTVSLQITLVFSRFYRAYSSAQVPVHELIRLVQLYSEPFDQKCYFLKKLYESNEIKKRMLKLALQKVTSMENSAQQYQEQKCLNNWERMYIRLALARSNVRQWKFRMQMFRKNAELGYEHIIEWLYTKGQRLSVARVITTNEEFIDDRIGSSEEVVQDQEKNVEQCRIDHISNDGKESDLLSHIEIEKADEPLVIKCDAEVQVQTDFDNRQTSTDDMFSTRSLMMRIYQPKGISKTRSRCIVYYQGQKYTTNVFLDDSLNIFKEKEKKQPDELLIPMPNVLKRRSLCQTDIDPDTIKIDILGDEKLYGSLIFSSEDLLMLDLPTLHAPKISPLLAMDDSLVSSSVDTCRFDPPSNEIYHSWISHTPQTFPIYNDRHQSIGKLPLLMFWYEKLENTHATKSTMTIPMETPLFTPNDEIEEIIVSRTGTAIESSCAENFDDQLEAVRVVYENEIVEIHKNYQAEIYRLTHLLNEMVSRQSTQTFDVSEVTREELPTVTDDGIYSHTKEENISEEQPSTISRKDLPKNFLDRYQMYLQQSLLHRHELIAKIAQETSLANERQMDIQHRLYKSEDNQGSADDLCLPAVFMPFRSGNVFNPKAYQFFHPIGSQDPRLSQAPSIIKLPSLPARSASVLNLFELSQSYASVKTKKPPH